MLEFWKRKRLIKKGENIYDGKNRPKERKGNKAEAFGDDEKVVSCACASA